MKRSTGSSMVEGGYYWNINEWRIVAVLGERGVLEGTPEDRYLRVPLPLLVPLALLMGGLYVMFLPLIGFVVALYALARKVGLAGSRALQKVVVAPTWQPGEAHFAGKAEEPNPDQDVASLGKPLDDLKELIDAARKAEKSGH
ncbi:MAG: hypothetical protein H6Q89_2668 [Myxococcaceae bacterium]|nr:hypothetical protein [Myxococcaceae bacterium]